MSASLPLDILRKYKKDFRIFFESGTNEGDSVQTALEAGFQQIYSIEIEIDIAARAIHRFREFPQVTIIRSSSVEALKLLLPDLYEPIFFFLDGHPDCTNSITPLLDEIGLIGSHPFKDTILADDMRLMGQAKWTTVTKQRIEEAVLRKGPYKIVYENNEHCPGDLFAAEVLE